MSNPPANQNPWEVGAPSASESPQPQTPQKKPIYKRWWFWVILVLIVGGIGSALGGGDENATTAVSSSSPASVQIPDLAGHDGSAAQSALTAAGLVAGWDAGDETVLSPSNWVVTGSTPAAGETAATGSTVTLKVTRPEPSAGASTEAVTTGGLDDAGAMAACDAQGEASAPYGYNPSWVLGLHSKGYDSVSDSWIFIYDAKITNAYNAERTATIHCSVTGSNAAPEVTAFGEQ